MTQDDIKAMAFIESALRSNEKDESKMKNFSELNQLNYLAFQLDVFKKKLAHEERLDNVYLNMAEALAQLSHAERAKVGCLIVNEGGQIVSQGYNGTPSGFDNCCEEEEDPGHLVTKHEVLHAESNAISKCAKWGGSTDGATLYVTMSPCFECAKLIIQAGIKRVVYKELYRDASGIELLNKANIEVNHYVNGCQAKDIASSCCTRNLL